MCKWGQNRDQPIDKTIAEIDLELSHIREITESTYTNLTFEPYLQRVNRYIDQKKYSKLKKALKKIPKNLEIEYLFEILKKNKWIFGYIKDFVLLDYLYKICYEKII